ncbi:thioredoxin-related transmembrane protein 2 homolog [Planococcus citri]|uniref:thioredoxin-related transmembrane protein 2 homolog n=1 Tax=Planococcus citri TaxID=170843 RepID=UPI0031F760EF
MSLLADFRTLLKPYYWINILMSFSYVIFKKTPVLCNYMFSNFETKCEFDSRESDILLFMLIVVMIRSRKSGSVSMINYLTSSFMYCKVASLILWTYADIRTGILYGVLFLVLAIWVPEPTYEGPSNVVYFRTTATLEDELSKNKNITWLVCFYTVWNPSCVNFAPIFAQLSAEYGLDNLKFGKIDIGRYRDAAEKFGISDASTSKQLPTLILFKNGEEVMRRPCADSRGKLTRFFFTADNIKTVFDLNNLYKAVANKAKPAKASKDDKKKAE